METWWHGGPHARLSDRWAWAVIKPAALALSALYGLFFTIDLFVLEGSSRVVMALVASASAIVLAWIGLNPARLEPGPSVHRRVPAIGAIAIANSVIRLGLSAEAIQTTSLLLAAVGTAALLCFRSQLLALLAGQSVGWVVVAWPRLGTSDWNHMGSLFWPPTLSP